MKKTFNINISGYVFTIDEDAYELLRNYLDTLHNVFSNETDNAELVADLELRMAELLGVVTEGGALRLRRTEPHCKRGFRVPCGKFGEWFVALLGIAGAVLAMVLSFVPPSQINTGSPVVYILILFAGSAIFLIFPFLVYAKRKPQWRDPDTTFQPFNWEIEGRRPSQVSKWPEGYQPTDAQIRRAMEWEDGELGPVSLKTVGEITDLSIKPKAPGAEASDNTDPKAAHKDSPK